MGCILRIVAGIAAIVLAISIICMFAKWLASGFDISWGVIWGMFGGSLGVCGVCYFLAARD